MNKPADLARFTVNGRVVTSGAALSRRLSEVLREDLGLFGTKIGCDAGDCGACTVRLEGEMVCACLTPMAHVIGKRIETVEGLAEESLSNLQQAFADHGAAQCGICTPGMLMATAKLLDDGPHPDRAQIEQALAGVLCRCTGYAKIIDAVQAVGANMLRSEPNAKPNEGPKTGNAVGASLPRLDGRAKLDGTEQFGADISRPDMLSVRAVRSSEYAAKFSFGNIGQWAQQHGIAVFTAADLPGENSFSVIPAFADQPALAISETRMRGEAVAIIAGPPDLIESLDLSEFPVSWQPLTPVLDPQDAIEARAVYGPRSDNVLTRGRVVQGDAETALARSAHRASVEIATSYVEHAYIEPEAGIAWMDGDVLVIRACTQAPVMDQEDVARVLGLSLDCVRIIPAVAGGGFGSKLDVSLQPLIGLAALKTGKPCRMIYSRAESMQSTTKRHPAQMSAEIGADAQGKITAMRFDGVFNTGPYSSWGPTVATRVPVHASGPYLTPNYSANTVAVHTNGPVSGAFRGFGVPQAAVVQEVLYDDLALSLGLDRLEFRKRNALDDADRSVCGQQLFGVGIGACLEALSDPWQAGLEKVTALNTHSSTLRYGLGVASCWYGCGNTALPNPSTIRVGITSDGQVCLHQGATDIGQGSNTVIAQICADAVGLNIRDFMLIGPDTALTPDCGKTSASRQTVVTGNAALRAGRALRTEILARTNMGAEASLTLVGDQISVTDRSGSVRIALAGLEPNAQGYVLMAEESYDPPTTILDENGQGAPYAVYGYGAQMALVSVDKELGVVKVSEMTAAHDLGRVINPQLAEGQIEGGIAQGLGMALMEEYIPGRTENLHDYLIPTIGDMPAISSILLEVPDPEGPMGAKGLGEHVLIPTAPAILNAIRHASGARLTQLPALPHRVLAAIQQAGPQ